MLPHLASWDMAGSNWNDHGCSTGLFELLSNHPVNGLRAELPVS